MNKNWVNTFKDWYRENMPATIDTENDKTVCYSDDNIVFNPKLQRNYKKFGDIKEGDRLFHEGKHKVYAVDSVVENSTSLVIHFRDEDNKKGFGGQVWIPREDKDRLSSFTYQYHKLFTSFYEYRDFVYHNTAIMLNKQMSVMNEVMSVEKKNQQYEASCLKQKKEEFEQFLNDICTNRINNLIWYILSKCPHNKCVDTLLMQTIWLCDRMCLQKYGYVITSDKYKKSDLGPVNANVIESINSNFFEKSFADVVFKEGCPNMDEINDERREIVDTVMDMIANMTNNEITFYATNSPENTVSSDTDDISLPVMMKPYRDYKDINGFQISKEQYLSSLSFLNSSKEV